MKRKQTKIVELKSVITELKNSLHRFNSIFKQAEGRINETEDKSTEITQSEKQKKE